MRILTHFLLDEIVNEASKDRRDAADENPSEHIFALERLLRARAFCLRFSFDYFVKIFAQVFVFKSYDDL